MEINKIKCKLSVNYKIRTKNDIGKYNNSFEERSFNIDDLERHVRDGYAFTSLLSSSNRDSKSFKSIQFLALDFDGTISLQEFLNLQETKELVALIYTTLSHQQNGEDRFRAVFVLEKSLTDQKKFKFFIKELMRIFSNLSDSNCSDPCRLWLGARNCEIQRIGNILTESFIEERLKTGEEEEHLLKESKKISNTLKSPISYEQVEQLLQIIPKEPGYQIWRNIVWSIASYFTPEETYSLVNNWSPDDSNGEVVKRLIKEYKNEF